MDLTAEQRRRIARAARLDSPLPDGPLLPRFDALELAQALERELERAAHAGHTKIRIDLDLVDTQALASALRRIALLR